MTDLTIIKATTYYASKLIKDLKKLQNYNNKDKTNMHLYVHPYTDKNNTKKNFLFIFIFISHTQNHMFAYILKYAYTLNVLLAR